MGVGIKLKELDTDRGTLQIRIREQGVEIAGYRGKDTELVIPQTIDGGNVTGIGKKAFLSNKMLERISLPETVTRIDDWAFAYCAKLRSIILPYRRMECGQGIFKDCPALEQIMDDRADVQDKKTVDVARMLAAAVGSLDAFYLFDLENAGSAEWLAKWDSRMMSVMERDDAEGFSRMLLCGEEEYGSRENDPDYYTEQRRKEKVRIAMLRLMHDYRLEAPMRSRLQEYLLAHVKGKETEETWTVILEEHGDDLKYYQFLTELGGVSADNFQPMMEDMGERHTEMKAYLMKYHGAQRTLENAFAAFEL